MKNSLTCKVEGGARIVCASAKELLAPARELARTNCTRARTAKPTASIRRGGHNPTSPPSGGAWRRGQTLGKILLCCNTGSNWPKHGAKALAGSGSAGWAPLRPPIAVYQATTGAPGYYPTAPQRKTKSQDSPRLARANPSLATRLETRPQSKGEAEVLT